MGSQQTLLARHFDSSGCVLCKQEPASDVILDLGLTAYAPGDCRAFKCACLRREEPTTWFHQKCYDVLCSCYGFTDIPSPIILAALGSTTRPLYTPWPDVREEEGRSSVFEGLMSNRARPVLDDNCFRQDLFAKFPGEIQLQILDFIGPCWYLIVLSESIRLIEQLCSDTGDEPRFGQLNVSHDVYIARRQYGGVSYIAWLSNSPFARTFSKDVEIQHLQPKANVQKIVLSVDHIGIRNMQLLDADSVPSADDTRWYKTIKVPKTRAKKTVRFHCDGLFIRWMVRSPLRSSGESRIKAWTTPWPPKTKLPRRFSNNKDRCRLDYIRLTPDIQGLVVCCTTTGIRGIHGFSRTSKRFMDFAQRFAGLSNTHKISAWFYFPLDAAESIESAWVCYGKPDFARIRPPGSISALIIRTTRGRTFAFGRYVDSVGSWSFPAPLVGKQDGLVTGLYHNGEDEECPWPIIKLGMTCDASRSKEGKNEMQLENEQAPMERYQLPDISPLIRRYPYQWYMTRAPLEGLEKIRICRDPGKPEQACQGALLYYADGTLESLGQFRWDLDTSRVATAPVWIENSDGADDRCYYIKHVEEGIEKPSKQLAGWDIPGRWQEIREGSGTVVWWFLDNIDRIVIYDGEKLAN